MRNYRLGFTILFLLAFVIVMSANGCDWNALGAKFNAAVDTVPATMRGGN